MIAAQGRTPFPSPGVLGHEGPASSSGSDRARTG
ncbi:hypothetical protein [Streptosporangium subroseum]